ncbi:MAG TPA: hypothetical protein VN848_07465, partial [Gemmatimonadales bacterium]|nr:hypothetical protein [Gemmatimonadales bacterium]
VACVALLQAAANALAKPIATSAPRPKRRARRGDALDEVTFTLPGEAWPASGPSDLRYRVRASRSAR